MGGWGKSKTQGESLDEERPGGSIQKTRGYQAELSAEQLDSQRVLRRTDAHQASTAGPCRGRLVSGESGYQYGIAWIEGTGIDVPRRDHGLEFVRCCTEHTCISRTLVYLT